MYKNIMTALMLGAGLMLANPSMAKDDDRKIGAIAKHQNSQHDRGRDQHRGHDRNHRADRHHRRDNRNHHRSHRRAHHRGHHRRHRNAWWLPLVNAHLHQQRHLHRRHDLRGYNCYPISGGRLVCE